MTNPQKYNQEFEKLSEAVVRCLFDGTDAEIFRTSSRKDGGYDIVALCFDGTTRHKVYFECKLRSGNLNLRDIAANVVIAFNEGAVGLVALTNCDYTPQADEQITQFCEKTILNVKIIVGDEIRRMIIQNNIEASDELLSMFQKAKTRRRDDSTALKLDFMKPDLYRQLLDRESAARRPEENYLTALLSRELDAAAMRLQSGDLIAVSGYAGVGKSSFISAVLDRCPHHQIHIDTLLYETQEHFLLGLLMQIWGIPWQYLLTDLTEEHIHTISSLLGGGQNDAETAQIIEAILTGDGAAHVHGIQYNFLVCQYLISLLEIHKSNIRYVFYFENLQFANREIFELTLYFIRLLQNREIGCVVEYQTGEYVNQSSNSFLPELSCLKHYYSIEIDILTEKQALEYLRYTCPDLPRTTARTIVKMVGCRLYNLSLTLDYFSQCGIDLRDSRRVASEINALTPNDIPNIVSKFLPFYRDKHRSLFDLLEILHGEIPGEFFPAVNLEIDALIDERILMYKQGYVIPANEFVRQKFLSGVGLPKPRQMAMADKLLDFTEKTPQRYQSARIYLLYYTQRYSEALSLLDNYIESLRRTRQYSALIQYLDMAIDIALQLPDDKSYVEYLVQQLDIMVIKKEIAEQKAGRRLSELSNALRLKKGKEDWEKYQLAHDYFWGKREFKSGQISVNRDVFQISRRYCEDCVNGIYIDNTGDWLGRICSNYAMVVKETQGNEQALTVFQRAFKALPDSFELRREYSSHIACMKLYDDPLGAHTYYEKIISMFDAHPTICALPFHEYGDLAMSLLLAGRSEEAVRQAEYAITLADSYGALDDVGRITNIKGCACLCMGNMSEAKTLFAEATAIMERAHCQLYCWRSRLNELQMELGTGDKNRQKEFLYETYNDFKTLLGDKVRGIAGGNYGDLLKTREYHALLVFGRCFRLMGERKEEDVAKEFALGRYTQTYLSQVELLTKDPSCRVIEGSPYFCHGKIFMIG